MISQDNGVGNIRQYLTVDETLTIGTETSPGAGAEFQHRIADGLAYKWQRSAYQEDKYQGIDN